MTGAVARFADVLPEMLADIVELVSCESPSCDGAALERSAATLADVGERILGEPPEILRRGGVPHVRWRWPAEGARVLVLGHHDTVWPIGSLAERPCEVRDGILRGPGCFDMKAGVVIALHAIAALPDRRGITLLVTGDEELGSRTSRALIEEEARGCAATLVAEPAGTGGRLKLARSGVAHYDVIAHGRAAHAGLEPAAGINATVEIAHQVLALSRIGRPDEGTTVTPTLVRGGTTENTVPDSARVHVDVRATAAAELQRVDASIRALAPCHDGARLEVRGGENRPPLPMSSSRALFERARALGHELGIGDLAGGTAGGGSDGNFTAASGIPTLDGLGAVGGGPHAESEHVVCRELPPRTALLSALLADVLAPVEAPTAATPQTP